MLEGWRTKWPESSTLLKWIYAEWSAMVSLVALKVTQHLGDAGPTEAVATENAHKVLHVLQADAAGHLFQEVPIVVTIPALQFLDSD